MIETEASHDDRERQRRPRRERDREHARATRRTSASTHRSSSDSRTRPSLEWGISAFRRRRYPGMRLVRAVAPKLSRPRPRVVDFAEDVARCCVIVVRRSARPLDRASLCQLVAGSGEELRDLLFTKRMTFFPDVPDGEAETDIHLPSRTQPSGATGIMKRARPLVWPPCFSKNGQQMGSVPIIS